LKGFIIKYNRKMQNIKFRFCAKNVFDDF